MREGADDWDITYNAETAEPAEKNAAIIDSMLIAAWRRVTALRQPVAAARLARMLYVAWAVIVWNVVFDRVIVVAGRGYIRSAIISASSPDTPVYQRMDDWMRPAVSRGFWMATAASGAIVLTGLVAVRFAANRPKW